MSQGTQWLSMFALHLYGCGFKYCHLPGCVKSVVLRMHGRSVGISKLCVCV